MDAIRKCIDDDESLTITGNNLKNLPVEIARGSEKERVRGRGTREKGNAFTRLLISKVINHNHLTITTIHSY